jgi:UDP-glucose 4-epimerase
LLGSVLRLAAVYGPSVKGNYERLLIGLARRRGESAGLNRRTLVFEDDVARAVLLAAAKVEAGAQVFNVTDGEIHTVREIIAAIAAGLGRKAPALHVPAGAARFAVAAAEAACRTVGRPSPVTRATLDKYLEDVAVSGQRLRDTLGFQPQWGLDQGWSHTIHELRRQGRL